VEPFRQALKNGVDSLRNTSRCTHSDFTRRYIRRVVLPCMCETCVVTMLCRPTCTAVPWSQVRCLVLGLIAYVHGVSVVLSRTAPTTQTSCRVTQFDDVESRTVVSSLVVDAVVEDLRRVGRTSSGAGFYRARLTVIDVLKGRLRESERRPSGLVTIAVGTFVRASRRAGSIPTRRRDVDGLCVASQLPVRGARYIVFLQQPTSTSSSSRPVVYHISSSPEPFSVRTMNAVRLYSRQRYGL